MAELTTAAAPAWHAMSAADITGALEVDPHTGLTAAEAGKRLEQDGPTG